MAEKQEFLTKLGHRIDAIRKDKELSFSEMAIRCDMEKSNLVKLTKHGTNITVHTMYKISKGLDTTIADIFDF